jgi:hypothetical protein
MAVNTRAVLLLESDAAASPDTLTATRPFRVYDVHGVVSTQGGGGDTTTVQRQPAAGGGFNAVSSALAADAAVNALGAGQRTTSVAGAQDDFAVGDTFRVNNSGTGRLQVYTKIIPRAVTGA